MTAGAVGFCSAGAVVIGAALAKSFAARAGRWCSDERAIAVAHVPASTLAVASADVVVGTHDRVVALSRQATGPSGIAGLVWGEADVSNAQQWHWGELAERARAIRHPGAVGAPATDLD